MILVRPMMTVSMGRWKLARLPNNPINIITHWNRPMLEMVKAVYWLLFGFSNICQKPEVRSVVEKIVLPDWPISPIHSLTFMWYLSVCVWVLKAQKSFTKQSLLLCNCKNWTIELGSGWLNYT